MTAFEEEVARGIALLDEVEPGWRSRINVDRLDMLWASRDAGKCSCIGAQLATEGDEDYYGWAERVSGYDSHQNRDEFDEWACSHGFEAPGGRYPELTGAWRRALIEEGGL